MRSRSRLLTNITILLAMLVASIGLVGSAGVATAQVACDTSASTSSGSATASATPTASDVIAFPDDGGELRVFAAASLVDAFAQIETDVEATNPNVSITVETAGSQALVTQLQEGAEADVLATANTSTMTTAIESDLIDGDPQTFTGNRLVIIAPTDNPAGIDSIDDLAADGLNLVLAGADVPVGSYSRTVLCNYDASGDAPKGFIDALNGNVVSEEVDVRSVLTKVQLGEADAGIVYASDAVASQLAGEELTVLEFPDSLSVTAVYPIAPVSGGNTELAQAFISYVLSEDGQATLESFGFVYP